MGIFSQLKKNGESSQWACSIGTLVSLGFQSRSVSRWFGPRGSHFWLLFLDGSAVERGFPGGTEVKNPPANTGDARDSVSIPGSRRSPGEGKGNPLQCSCLRNPKDKGAWQVTVNGVAKGWTRLPHHDYWTDWNRPYFVLCGNLSLSRKSSSMLTSIFLNMLLRHSRFLSWLVHNNIWSSRTRGFIPNTFKKMMQCQMEWMINCTMKNK